MAMHCTLREVRNVTVVKDHPIFQHISQASQTRATHNGHQGAYLCVGEQPLSCGLALIIAIPEAKWEIERAHRTLVNSTPDREQDTSAAIPRPRAFVIKLLR